MGWLDVFKVGELLGGCGRRIEGEDFGVLVGKWLTLCISEFGLNGGRSGVKRE